MQKEAIQPVQEMKADKLPTLPHVLLRLLEACQNENVSFEHMAGVISKDPALCLKIISTCGTECTSKDSLEKSLARLGINTVKSIAITSAVRQFFADSSQARTSFLKQHWHHSIHSACIAEQLAESIGYRHPGEAWHAGLLHDAGQLIMESAYRGRYSTELASAGEDASFHASEAEALESTHDLAGASLLNRHSGNTFFVDAIRYHHEPVDKLRDAHPLVKITNLANLLSLAEFEQRPGAAVQAAEQLFGLSAPVVERLLKHCNGRIAQIAEEFDIEIVDIDADDDATQKILASDQLKQYQLAEQIRNIAMLDGVHQHLSRIEGQKALLQALKRNIFILFGVSDCTLFLYDAGNDTLEAVAFSETEPHLQDVRIPLEPGRSIVADALLEMDIINTFETGRGELSILDRQLIGLNNSEGLLCLPLIVHNAAVGSLVLGVDEAGLPALARENSLLQQFATDIASTIGSALAEFRDEEREESPSDPDEILKARAREVIHEARNPLSIINNYLEILSVKLEGDAPAQQDLETIRSEIYRINTILEKLSQPSPVETSETAPVDINALIADLSHMFQTSLFAAHDIDISLDLDENMPPMLTSEDALKQIYTNLVKNAVEALPAEGLVMVYTQDQVNVDGKPHFEICVADDGPGIPAEILPDLFTPVQSTKGEGHAGLGLTIVKNLVNELHGSISCRSSDKGTSFHILLPRKSQE